MASQGSIRMDDEVYVLGPAASRVANVAGVIGVIGCVVAIAAGFLQGDWAIFFRSYLLNYAYVLSLALGALCFVMIQHVTRAGWSVSVRRLAEFMAATLPLMGVLFLPMLIPVLGGMEGVYKWADAQTVAKDELLQHKAPYLNAPFFVIRCLLYFGIWIGLARVMLRQSAAQDTDGDVSHTFRLERWSAPGLLLYAFSVTFFAIDALMSLNPHWFSTIWGVYYFSGALVGFFALLALLVIILQGSGKLVRVVTVEHYHDIGKLAFGFVVFWAYIAFSQYMLIWYANIPEETAWYLPRQDNSWWLAVSLVLLCGHFFAPFLAIMSRWPKRRKSTLAVAAIWLLVMHWLDLYYITIPRPYGYPQPESPLYVSDLALLVGLGGLFVFAMVRPMAQYKLLPVRDPRLHESLAFENI